MNILLIGGTRFIGPVLARQLHARGDTVFLFHRTAHSGSSRYTHIQGSCDHVPDLQRALEQAAPDVIVHMAAYFQRDIDALTLALNGRRTKTVIASSADVYKGYEVLIGLSDAQPIPGPFTEQSPLRDVHFPFRDKMDTEFARDYEKILVEQAALQSPVIDATILRLGMVYGENDPNRRLSDWIHQMAAGAEAITLSQDYAQFKTCKCYVENIAHGLALATTHTHSDEIYNLSDESVYTELEWLHLIAHEMAWRGEVVLSDTRTDGLNTRQHFVMDTQKARQQLTYREIVSVDSALQRTIAWELEQPRR